MIIEFEKSALMHEAVALIRDKHTKPPAFRKNMRRLGRYLFYEAAKRVETRKDKVRTPLAAAEVTRFKHDVVIISILRASLPMVDGVIEELNEAALGVISASRGEMLDEEGKEFAIQTDYIKLPPLTGKIAILVDPMLATASTISFLIDVVKKENPSKIILLCAIASRYGIDRVNTRYPEVQIYTAAIDAQLDNKGYIVPGLGDAGDRACNTPH